MNRYVVTVDFKLKPGALGHFRTLIDQNAIDSCKYEPGCHRFDVVVPLNETDAVFLYEIYNDRAAFQTHLKTAHYAIFDRDSNALVASKTVRVMELACEGRK
jgi:(4S)-4-hydroxy-5-phosphonooxypentane-2,3-dione isomerase